MWLHYYLLCILQTSLRTFDSPLHYEDDDEVQTENIAYENNGETFNASTLDVFTNQVNNSNQLFVVSKILNGIESKFFNIY